MSTITPSIPTGAFLEHQTISFSFGPGTSKVTYSTGDIPPSISKYIAYDTLTPPNPFLAVTEDGRGRVVYDGGFPKFYSVNAYKASATQFSHLNPACKFLYNAIYWVANSRKVEAGNKRILVLADNVASNHYNIMNDNNEGFSSTIAMMSRVTGFSIVKKDLDSYGGSVLNPTLAELEEYALVIIFGVGWHVTTGKFTATAVNDIVTYRENGNGIIMITDHGNSVNSPEQAATSSSGFFSSVNQIASRFGAYFTGNYDRFPVNVGFLRRTYGDHPLYNNLTDAENISAGGSESRVVVTESVLYDPDKLPPVTTTVNGMNTINVLALLEDGSVITARYVYIVQGDEFLWIIDKPDDPDDPDGEQLNPGEIRADDDGNLIIDADVDGSALGTVWGELLKNGVRVGEIHYANGQSNLHIYGGGNSIKVRDGDVIELRISTPFSYSKITTVRRREADMSPVTLAALNKNIGAVWGGVHVTTPLLRHHNTIVDGTSLDKKVPVTMAEITKKIYNIINNRTGGAVYTTNIYASQTELTQAINSQTVVPGECFVNAANGAVFAYVSGEYKELPGVKAKDIFPPPCVLTNGKASWAMSIDGTLTLET